MSTLHGGSRDLSPILDGWMLLSNDVRFLYHSLKMYYGKYRGLLSAPASIWTVVIIISLLDQEAQNLCTIILPRGKRSYTRMPIGLMVAIDIFQQCMQSMFHSLLDSIIIYIENNLLFTKGSFEHHLQKLKQVFIILLANSRHVHIEQTFLTSTAVNYLGYTLTSKGRKRIFLLSFGLLHHKMSNNYAVSWALWTITRKCGINVAKSVVHLLNQLLQR